MLQYDERATQEEDKEVKEVMTPDDARAYRNILMAYLSVKAAVFDWHGVSDAANDLRELEARYPFLIETNS